MGFFGNLVHGAEEFLSPALHAAHPLIEAAEGAGGMLGTAGKFAGKYLPGVGCAMGVGTALHQGYEAIHSSGEERWDHIGNAVMGGAGAVASFCPPAAAYLGAGELAVNGAGAASGALGGPKFSAGGLVGQGLHSMYDFAHEHPLAAAAGAAIPIPGLLPAMTAGNAAWNWMTGRGRRNEGGEHAAPAPTAAPAHAR
jgi:hypothetical protein